MHSGVIVLNPTNRLEKLVAEKIEVIGPHIIEREVDEALRRKYKDTDIYFGVKVGVNPFVPKKIIVHFNYAIPEIPESYPNKQTDRWGISDKYEMEEIKTTSGKINTQAVARNITDHIIRTISQRRKAARVKKD